MRKNEARRRSDRLLLVFMGVSLLAHTACVTTFALLQGRAKPAIQLDDNVVKARLVKLGKKRDERLLPRIDKTRPAPPIEKKAPPTQDPSPVPKPPSTSEDAKPKPSASDILDRFREENDKPNLDNLIKKAVGDPLDEGSEEGSKIGSDITGRLQADYNDELIERIRSLWELPNTISDEERVRLMGYLHLRIGANGQLLEAEIDKTSGNNAFDNAMIAAAKKAAPFPPPPLVLRDFYAAGVTFRVRP